MLEYSSIITFIEFYDKSSLCNLIISQDDGVEPVRLRHSSIMAFCKILEVYAEFLIGKCGGVEPVMLE